MPEFTTPQPIELTPEETELRNRIPKDPDDIEGDWEAIADSMLLLMKSLSERNAIPESRLLIFNNPDYGEIAGDCPRKRFEAAGVHGDDIYRAGSFMPHLVYFLNGPRLPKSVMQGVCDILNRDRGTSGDLQVEYRKFVRKCVRDYSIPHDVAPTALFQLGVEIGMEVGAARAIRKAAQEASR